MTRVLHTGDTHLGYRQYHSPERREDFHSAFESVVDDAIELDVTAVVHAGDLFHDRRPNLDDILGCLDVLRNLDAANIPFLGVVGNHEMKRDSQWLDLFASMGLARRLGAEPVEFDDVAFYGLDFVPRSRRDELEYDFTPHESAHAVLVAHGLFEPLVPDYGSIEWDAGEVLDRASVDFDAMLLGDEHAPAREQVSGTWVTYCGSTERASATERDDRGYNLVTFDDGVQITRRGIETREFVFVDLELESGEGFERIRRRLEEHELDDAVVHVTLSGDGEDVSPARIESFATEAGALVARVRDRREQSRDPSDPDVAFADPDVAVRQRIRELPLSDAANDVDRTVRGDTVADSNVADEVQRQVADMLDEPTAFDVPDLEDQTETTYDDRNEPVIEATCTESDSEPGVSTASEPTSGSSVESLEETDVDNTDSMVEPTGSESTTKEPSSESARSGDQATPSADSGDDQASMEDYL